MYTKSSLNDNNNSTNFLLTDSAIAAALIYNNDDNFKNTYVQPVNSGRYIIDFDHPDNPELSSISLSSKAMFNMFIFCGIVCFVILILFFARVSSNCLIRRKLKQLPKSSILPTLENGVVISVRGEERPPTPLCRPTKGRREVLKYAHSNGFDLRDIPFKDMLSYTPSYLEQLLEERQGELYTIPELPEEEEFVD